MSLLTDPEFLLQSLFSSYVALLPINSTQNLISNSDSLHVQLAGLKIPHPRASPPFESVLDLQNGRRGLNYSKTIVKDGSLGGMAGMRVGGRHRSWKGKGIMTAEEELVVPESSIRDRLNIPDLPPVVVHSPFDSPIARSAHIVPASPFSFTSSNDANSSVAHEEEYESDDEDEVDSEGDEISETTGDLESIREELQDEEAKRDSGYIPRRATRRVNMSSLEQFRISQQAMLPPEIDPTLQQSIPSTPPPKQSSMSTSNFNSSVLAHQPIASTPSLVTSLNNASSFDSRLTSITGDSPAPAPFSPGPLLDFTRITPARSRDDSFSASDRPSGLTQLLQAISSTPVSTNPFSRFYGALSSLEITTTFNLSLSLYFPDCETPNKPIEVKTRKDLSVEEVIGVGLFWFVEQGLLPEMKVGEHGELETAKWNLRIVEEDGEVDDDFPALDRSRQIAAFTFPAFAIVAASTTQIKDNEQKQSKIVRRASRILAGAPIIALIANNVNIQQEKEHQGDSLALQVLLKIILIGEEAGEGTTTTLAVMNTTYLSDVLAQICKKKGIDNSKKEFALVVQIPLDALLEAEEENNFLILPEDRTVESLGEIRELELRKVGKRAENSFAGTRLNSNPSASVFKRLSEPPMPKYQRSSTMLYQPSRNDPTQSQNQAYTNSNYFSYSVQRKLSLPLSSRHSRNIVIDLTTAYLYFLPSNYSLPVLLEGIFSGESDKVKSFPGHLVVEAKESRKRNGGFKICIKRLKGIKRFDFETERRVAVEIVKNVNILIQISKEVSE